MAIGIPGALGMSVLLANQGSGVESARVTLLKSRQPWEVKLSVLLLESPKKRRAAKTVIPIQKVTIAFTFSQFLPSVIPTWSSFCILNIEIIWFEIVFLWVKYDCLLENDRDLVFMHSYFICFIFTSCSGF